MPDELPVEEVLTPKERTVSYVLNSLSGVFQSAKAGLQNVELCLYANPVELQAQDAIGLFGKQAAELVGICTDGKVFLARICAFLQAAETEVVAAQSKSVKAAELATAVKKMAADKGAAYVEHKPDDVAATVNPDGTVTIAAVEVAP